MNDMELSINLKALRRVDPCIQKIEDYSSQVALYKFHSGKGDWDKTEVEGTLFVYKREAEPCYGFTIMNRLNMDNLVEPVTKDLDIQLQTPFLLYRNYTGNIYGIWFYEQAECERVGKKIDQLVNEVEDKVNQEAVEHDKGDGNKLGQLLSKANKEKVEKVPEMEQRQDEGRNLLRLLSQPESVVPSQVKETRPIPTAASVKDFFALASSTQQADSTSPIGFTSASVGMAPENIGMNGSTTSALPMTQGLELVGQRMTNSSAGSIHNPPIMEGVHSVECLEAEQRAGFRSPPQLHTGVSDLESRLKQSLHIGEQIQQPTLLSPHMFSSLPPPLFNGRENSPPIEGSKDLDRPTTSGSVQSPVALNQQQMLEAFSYMLQNDQEFVSKLHKAYVQSINEKFSKSVK